jgi:uncharacterized protein YndB with AHSA1/START domain
VVTVESPDGTPVVRLERLLAASRERVYAAWIEPALLGKWMAPRGHAEVSLDPRVGGALHVVMADAGVRIEHHGEFLELDPPRRLRFTWMSPYTGSEPSVVTVELSAEGDRTRLVLLHERLPADTAASHAGGWSAIVDRLADVLNASAAEEVLN